MSPLAEGLALIFDMDGVIVDSNPVHRDSWIAFHHSAKGTGMTVPPSRSIASTFVRGA